MLNPDWRADDGLAVLQVTTQHVLAELGRVDAAAAGRLDFEALQEEALEDLQGDTEAQMRPASPRLLACGERLAMRADSPAQS